MKDQKQYVVRAAVLFLAAGCLGVVPLSVEAGEPMNHRVYSDRGMASTGMFPAKDLVKEFWDIPTDFDMNINVGRKGTIDPYLPKADLKPGDRKNILWRITLPNWGNKRLITSNPDFTIEHLMSRSGFRSRSLFHRIFARHTGTTPSEFRSGHRSGGPQKPSAGSAQTR